MIIAVLLYPCQSSTSDRGYYYCDRPLNLPPMGKQQASSGGVGEYYSGDHDVESWGSIHIFSILYHILTEGLCFCSLALLCNFAREKV